MQTMLMVRDHYALSMSLSAPFLDILHLVTEVQEMSLEIHWSFSGH